ncbi:MAG: hypothetical protein ABIO70_34395 [Pseudomonadota bacterium]
MAMWLLLALLHPAAADPRVALSRDASGVVGSNATAGGSLRPASSDFDDGRLINRAAARGGLDLGLGRESPLGWEPGGEPGWLLRPVARGAAWWQTRDLDLALQAALLPTIPLGAQPARPDSLVDLALDLRPAPAVGVLLDGRFLAESRELAPVERTEPQEPWEVASWSSGLSSGSLASSARLRPVVEFGLGEGLALELGGTTSLHRYRLPDEPFAEAGQRLGAGPRAGLRLALGQDLSLLGRGQVAWFSWTGLPTEAGAFGVVSGNPEGLAWQAWGGLEGRVSRPLRLRLLAGWDGVQVRVDRAAAAGLLLAGRLVVGAGTPHQLTLDLRRGPSERRTSGFGHAQLEAAVGYEGRVRDTLELEAAAGWQQRADAFDPVRGAALARAGLSAWPLPWLGLGLHGWAEQGVWRDAPGPDFGAQASLRLGRIAAPSWVAPPVP